MIEWIKHKFKTVSLLRKEFICNRPKTHNLVTGRVKKATFLPVLKLICKVWNCDGSPFTQFAAIQGRKVPLLPPPQPPAVAVEDHCHIRHSLLSSSLRDRISNCWSERNWRWILSHILPHWMAGIGSDKRRF